MIIIIDIIAAAIQHTIVRVHMLLYLLLLLSLSLLLVLLSLFSVAAIIDTALSL